MSIDALAQIRPDRRFAVLVARDPRAAIEQHADLERRHERLKGAAMDTLDVTDLWEPRGEGLRRRRDVLNRLREALYAEARE